MARTKKTATKNATPVIVRSLDMPSLEKRVFNMDGAKIRNYDLFSLEERIYQLEKNGGGGGGSSSVKYDSGTFTFSGNAQGTVDVTFENIEGIADFIVVEYTINSKKMISDFSKFNFDLSDPHYFCSRYISPDDFLDVNVSYGATSGYPAIVGVDNGKFTFKSGGAGYTGVEATYKAYKYVGE